MSSADAVRARVKAVEDVAEAVRSFAGQIRQVTTDARAELRRVADRMHEELHRRQQVLGRAQRATVQAEAALAGCRENCGELANAVDAARRRQAEAEQAVASARRAVDMVTQASAGFGTVVGGSERVVEEHGHAAVAACVELIEQLKGYLATGG